MKGLKSQIENYRELPEDLRAKLTSSFLSTPKMVEYYECYTSWTAKVLLIFREKKEAPLASVVFTHQEEELSYFGMPCEIMLHDNFELKQMKKITSFIFQELSSQFKNSKISFHKSYELDHFLSSQLFTTEVIMNGVVNLQENEDIIRQGFRKSYRSLINWGKNNLKINTFDKDIQQNHIDAFREFHIKVAGRETRTSETWNLQKEIVERGFGWINLAYLNRELVSANLIVHDNTDCYYAVAASNRTLMEEENLPLAHVLMESSIFKAKAEGLKTFDFGDIRQKEENPVKENSIRKFKSGFCNSYLTKNVIHLNLAGIS